MRPDVACLRLPSAREAGLAYASGGLSLLGRTGSIVLRVGLFGREVYEGTTNAYAGTQALMDGKPLTAVYHYGLTVLNLFGMKNAKGALDDAAEMLAPVFKRPQVVAKAETPQAKVFVNRAQSLLSRAGDVTRDDILGALEGLTKQADRIAAAIRGGDLQLNVLSDKLFDLAWRLKHGKGAAPQAFAYGEQLFVRRGSSNFLSEIVHEGTHGLDYLDNLTGTRRFFEKRAYYFERQFQLAGGGYLEFETLTDMLAHIFTYY